MKISQLKEMIEFRDKMISQKIIKEIDQRMKYCESSKTDDRNRHSTGRAREKRPFRLIPIAQKKMLNEDMNKMNENSIFYGPPFNCFDLFSLRYPLYGYYYLVKRVTDTSKNLETYVYCAFKRLE